MEGLTSMPSIDVVIPIHDPARQLDRALQSVFADAPEGVRAIVVCHGLETSAVSDRLEGLPMDRVQVVSFWDGVRSPAGPMNKGIDLSNADYVARLDSDDYLEPGALRAWQQRAAERDADVVIAEERHQNGAFIASPLVRPRRAHDLDAVRDRLYYRTSLRGLIRRRYLNEHGLRLTEGMVAGEDVIISTLLSSHARVELARGCPRYVMCDDAPSRVTGQSRRLSDIVEGIAQITEDPQVRALTDDQRRSLAIRLARTALLSAIRQRSSAADWDDDQVVAVREAVECLEAFGPGFLKPLSRTERAILDTAATDPDAAVAAHAAGGGGLNRVLTRNPLHVAARESMLRRYAVLLIDRGRARPGA